MAAQRVVEGEHLGNEARTQPEGRSRAGADRLARGRRQDGLALERREAPLGQGGSLVHPLVPLVAGQQFGDHERGVVWAWPPIEAQRLERVTELGGCGAGGHDHGAAPDLGEAAAAGQPVHDALEGRQRRGDDQPRHARRGHRFSGGREAASI